MSIYEVGPFQLDVEHLLLMRQGAPVALGPKVVETLLAFVEHPGDVLAKGLLVDRIWPEGFVEEANLAQNIHVLRRAFRQHGGADPIETVPRRGYRLVAPVRRLADVPLRRAPLSAPQPFAPRVARTLTHRITSAVAGAAFVAVSLVLVASYGFGHHGAAPAVLHRTATSAALSDKGARLYAVGRYYWNQRTRDGVRKSLDFFAHVIDADPQNARGYAALADANVAMGDYCYGTHQPSVYFARAHEYATRALALDPKSVEAHATLGVLALHRKNIAVAMTELRRAMALDPSYAPAQEWYGIALLGRGRLSEGIVHLKAAAELEPLAVATTAWLGSAAYSDQRFGDAILYSRQALELSPQRMDALTTLGEAYEATGDVERAVQAFKRYGAVGRYYRPQAAAMLAHAYALGHRMREARAELMYARTHASEVDPGDLAAAAAAVGSSGGRLPARRTRHASTYA